MIALSGAERCQPLRQIVPLEREQLFGVMPGELAALDIFGAKLVSVFGDPARPGRTRHRGVVVAYDGTDGEIICMTDAEEVTRIRTACATAAATDALARPDAKVLAVFGTGTQAESHLRALTLVRPFASVLLWGRSSEKAGALAARMSEELGIPITSLDDGREVAAQADVICTVSGAAKPILLGNWVTPGTHVNLVGSSFLGPVEADTALVVASRYIADHRPSALAQAAEFAAARAAGAVDDTHIVGEIGDVFSGRIPGRENDAQITLYKSLGHVVQDLAATAYLHRRAGSETFAQ
ncbi:MAG TPA: ornithine cyclodeaminase family protein [Sphingobium sp.]